MNKPSILQIGLLLLIACSHHPPAQAREAANQDGPAAVIQAWVQRYTGPGNLHDTATAITVDAEGNVYVTGWSSDTPEFPHDYDYDYATIKYDADGVVQWVRRYAGLGNGDDDRAVAIALDGQGNVYVTGRSQGIYLDYEYATIKYDPDGVQQWVRRYGGSYHNRATDLAVDAAGNVYVTGRSWGAGNEDYATIKYDTDGVPQWVARYGGPINADNYARSIAVDAAGNAYVTGQSIGSGTGWDYATVKYDAAGVEQWAARYNGPGSEFDVARKVAVDAAGNVYVTGYSVGLGTGRDYATIKYDTDGAEQWVARYDGPVSGTDEANDLVVDGEGNVYVTGYSVGPGTFYDYATVKYDAVGAEKWVARYSGPGNWDVARAIALDGAGRVYVTGNSTGTGTQYDYLTVAYDTDGTQLWVERYNGPGNADDIPYAICADMAGNVHVTGRSIGPGTPLQYEDYATIKYAPAVTSVDPQGAGVPLRYALEQNHPNPFNPATTIAFTIPRAGHVTLALYDVRGRKVADLVAQELAAGRHEIAWHAAGLSSGVYCYRLQAGSFTATRKLTLAR
jgi:uncharacterized delta-60 repeat protein